mmetsp:Transcript_8849/g.27196  ORF Transcript_8849/g.27196 Transcript_8849/m.27196 type:complete len:350 (-) Transcript_8849:42-1091(-)
MARIRELVVRASSFEAAVGSLAPGRKDPGILFAVDESDGHLEVQTGFAEGVVEALVRCGREENRGEDVRPELRSRRGDDFVDELVRHGLGVRVDIPQETLDGLAVLQHVEPRGANARGEARRGQLSVPDEVEEPRKETPERRRIQQTQPAHQVGSARSQHRRQKAAQRVARENDFVGCFLKGDLLHELLQLPEPRFRADRQALRVHRPAAALAHPVHRVHTARAALRGQRNDVRLPVELSDAEAVQAHHGHLAVPAVNHRVVHRNRRLYQRPLVRLQQKPLVFFADSVSERLAFLCHRLARRPQRRSLKRRLLRCKSRRRWKEQRVRRAAYDDEHVRRPHRRRRSASRT